MLVNPAAPRPISAGIQPDCDWISSTASTLKFENVAPPISGSLESAPSMAKTASTPRCPFTANCAVKLVAPFVSVMVPAASRSNWLKSRLLSGIDVTDLPLRVSPPLACAWLSCSSAIDPSACSAIVELPSSGIATGLAIRNNRPRKLTVSSYEPRAGAAK